MSLAWCSLHLIKPVTSDMHFPGHIWQRISLCTKSHMWTSRYTLAGWRKPAYSGADLEHWACHHVFKNKIEMVSGLASSTAMPTDVGAWASGHGASCHFELKKSEKWHESAAWATYSWCIHLWVLF